MDSDFDLRNVGGDAGREDHSGLSEATADIQKSIAQVRHRIMSANYATERGLSDYGRELGGSFRDALHGLKDDQLWIDVGAGEGIAAIDYLCSGGRARVAAITVEAPRVSWEDRVRNRLWNHVSPALQSQQPWQCSSAGAKMRYLTGRYIEEYSVQELGAADVVSDVYGAASYAPHIDEVLARLGELTKKGGKIFIRMGAYMDFLNLTMEGIDNFMLVDGEGRSIPVDAWFQAIEGARFEKMNDAIVLTKTGETISVPKLALLDYKDHAPPRRLYRWDSSPADAAR